VATLEVSARTLPLPGSLLGRSIDRPGSRMVARAEAVEVEGWVIGRRSPVRAIEVLSRGEPLARLPVDAPRPDVAAAFPSLEESRQCGFRGNVNILHRSGRLDLPMRAVLADGTRVPIGLVRSIRTWPESASLGSRPLVSVVIPCYGQAHFLPEAIESALDQTHPHVEVVVVDDGSPDNTREVASRYPGVRCVVQANMGLAAARNTGIRRSAGEFIVLLDADDRLLPGALEEGLRCLDRYPESCAAVGGYGVIGFDGSPIGPPVHPPAPEDPYLRLFEDNYVGAPASIFYRRSIFSEVGFFDPSIDAAADYDMYLRIARLHPITCHRALVSEYRKHGRSMSRDPALMLRMTRTVLQRHRSHARTDAARAAYRSGIRRWTSYYGGLLVSETSSSLRRRAWRKRTGDLLAMMRYYPRGLAPLLRGVTAGAHRIH
jgi:glycosyltransferase involved in cell wall biosynthesis